MFQMHCLFVIVILFCMHITGIVCKSNCTFTNYEKEHSAIQRIAALEGKTYSTRMEGFSYSVGICKTVTSTTDKMAGAVQYDVDKKSDHALGDIDKADIMQGTYWVMLEYRGGDSYGSHCNKEERRTIIMIICDPSASQGRLQLIEENNGKTGECYYLFELSHSAICNAESEGLGVGSIFCIVFFTLLGCYLVFGFLYQRFVVHAQGREQIPHYGFWQDVGNLVADGCEFVFRSKSSSGSRRYRGIGDEQIASQTPPASSPEIDDHLLPM